MMRSMDFWALPANLLCKVPWIFWHYELHQKAMCPAQRHFSNCQCGIFEGEGFVSISQYPMSTVCSRHTLFFDLFTFFMNSVYVPHLFM